MCVTFACIVGYYTYILIEKANSKVLSAVLRHAIRINLTACLYMSEAGPQIAVQLKVQAPFEIKETVIAD